VQAVSQTDVSVYRTSSEDAERLNNIEGRAQAITVMSPIKPFWSLWLRVLFRLTRQFPSITGPLRGVSFIHFARWNLVTRIPYNGPPQKHECLNYTYLLFTSNFNGTWDQYIDAFSYTVARQMSLIWGSSFGFPGPMPVQPFKDYIRRNEFLANHYYSAYPGASTTNIRSALELKRQFDAFQKETRQMPPEEFQKHYRALLTRVQRCL
jgi:hypothetical protein